MSEHLELFPYDEAAAERDRKYEAELEALANAEEDA